MRQVPEWVLVELRVFTRPGHFRANAYVLLLDED